jgi:ubiquinone biosynthesis protein COQ9
MQLKMVQQQLLHLQLHKVRWIYTKTSTKNTTRLSKVAEQIRDDESLSIIQRTQTNKDLGGVLKQQLNAELAIARHYL